MNNNNNRLIKEDKDIVQDDNLVRVTRNIFCVNKLLIACIQGRLVGLDSAQKPLNKEGGNKVVEEIGDDVIGFCSFEACEEFASVRCRWRNAICLSTGGCNELYCRLHANCAGGDK